MRSEERQGEINDKKTIVKIKELTMMKFFP